MLKPKLPVYGDIETTTTSELFEQLSISLDNNKFLRHKHIVSKPNLKRLHNFKSCSINSGFFPANNTISSFCSRCKKETLLVDNAGDDQHYSIPEKEVEEVKKEFIVKPSWEKKVHFLVEGFGSIAIGEIEEKADEKKADSLTDNHKDVDVHEENNDAVVSTSLPEQECVPVQFQSVFFAHRPSIIGNNEFWLPQYSSPGENTTKEESAIIIKSPTAAATPLQNIAQESEDDQEETEKVISDMTPDCTVSSCGDSTMTSGLSVFLNNIFKQTTKRQVKILQTTSMLDGTFAALTDEHVFHCKSVRNSYEIIDAICLKDVNKLMVNETCVILVMEVCHASSLIEFKEFVPGYSEKTESLISLMVYALSRIKNFLPDVARLPLLSLPTCENMHNWLAMQNEGIMYTGIAKAENISDPEYEDLRDQNFMMKTADNNQFHPVTLLVRSGYLTSKCNGGCASRGCKYSVTLALDKGKVSVMRREDNPWPNCVRLTTECMDITFAGSSKASADDLMEKLYACIQPIDKDSTKFYVCVLVTENYLQIFKMELNKVPVFGSPLLNLEIFDENADGTTCIIDAQGIEADDVENLQTQDRWHLTFLDDAEKMRFLAVVSVD